jgi:Tol biopolymer transport system component
VAQLTFEGNNEDPSWAPDGRHITFVGERSYGHGLYVVDTVTGRIRPVMLNVRARVPQWSPGSGSMRRRLQGMGLLALLVAGALPAAAAAQQRDTVPGVELGIVYQSVARPALAVKPFGDAGGSARGGAVEAIVARDLRFSNRFTVMDSLPVSVVGAPGVDYTLFDNLGAVWLLTGSVEAGSGGGSTLVLQLHDVVYRQLKETGRFPLPAANDPDFRMAVHRASDEVVRWATGEAGVAATRITFSMSRDEATELWVVDSDGENLRRLTSHGQIVLSPAWFPDGSRIAFSLQNLQTGETRIRELNLRSGREWIMEPGRGGQHMTPPTPPTVRPWPSPSWATPGGSSPGTWSGTAASRRSRAAAGTT